MKASRPTLTVGRFVSVADKLAMREDPVAVRRTEAEKSARSRRAGKRREAWSRAEEKESEMHL